MTLNRADVRVGQEIEALVGVGLNTRTVRARVIEIVENAHECYARCEGGAIAHLLRTTLYRCKFDSGDLPICPLANVRCHSPCDIDALAYGPSYAYPRVVRTPDA